jgi:hydantoinase/oxoprolinase-like protein
MPPRLGVDIGGTFTDLVLIDEATGRARVGKVLTSPKKGFGVPLGRWFRGELRRSCATRARPT